jgi:hypothetical protein
LTKSRRLKIALLSEFLKEKKNGDKIVKNENDLCFKFLKEIKIGDKLGRLKIGFVFTVLKK